MGHFPTGKLWILRLGTDPKENTMSTSKYKQALVAQLDQTEPAESLNDGEVRLYRLEDESGLVGAILYTETDRSVTGDFFEDEDELEAAWSELDDDEDEDDDDEGQD